MLTMYLLGAGFWGDFLNWGRLTFAAYDWPKELLYFNVVREALTHGRMPWHISIPAEYAAFHQFLNADDAQLCRFLAVPETVLSPQLVLLRWLTPGQFVLAHFLLLYTIGFVACLGFRRKYRLSLFPFGVLLALFNFNGFVTAHVAVGHVMIGGYFLLPFFVRLVLEWSEDFRSRAPAVALAVVFFAMFLQGALHMVIWCWLLLALITVFNRAAWRTAALAVGMGCLLASFRLVPTMIAYLHIARQPFLGGYPTGMSLVDALVTVHEPTYPVSGGIGFWELDVHVGLLGAFVLAFWGIYRRSAFAAHRHVALDLPLLFLALLSFGDLYQPIINLPLPFAASERVTARFFVVPLLFVLFVAVVRLQRDIERRELGFKNRLVALAALVMLGRDALAHSRVWWIGAMERMPNARWHALTPAVIVDVFDPRYVHSVLLGAAGTVIASALVVYLRRRRCPATTA